MRGFWYEVVVLGVGGWRVVYFGKNTTEKGKGMFQRASLGMKGWSRKVCLFEPEPLISGGRASLRSQPLLDSLSLPECTLIVEMSRSSSTLGKPSSLSQGKRSMSKSERNYRVVRLGVWDRRAIE